MVEDTEVFQPLVDDIQRHERAGVQSARPNGAVGSVDRCRRRFTPCSRRPRLAATSRLPSAPWSAYRSAGSLCLSIEIPSGSSRYISDEFYQVGVPASSTREGYGLGLSIVQRLVALLSGLSWTWNLRLEGFDVRADIAGQS